MTKLIVKCWLRLTARDDLPGWPYLGHLRQGGENKICRDFRALVAIGLSISCPRRHATASSQLVEKSLCVPEVGRVQAFGEAAVDRGEQIAGFNGAFPIAP